MSFNGQQVFRRWASEKKPWATKKQNWLPKGQISRKVSVQHFDTFQVQEPQLVPVIRKENMEKFSALSIGEVCKIIRESLIEQSLSGDTEWKPDWNLGRGAFFSQWTRSF